VNGFDIPVELPREWDVQKLRAALSQIVYTLGPDHICDCDEQHCDGLAAEAAEALSTARAALGGNP